MMVRVWTETSGRGTICTSTCPEHGRFCFDVVQWPRHHRGRWDTVDDIGERTALRHVNQQSAESGTSGSEWPRYSSRALPGYRFVPGVTPHPRRHPDGHSYGQPEPTLSLPTPDGWQANEAYLYGVDLYNCAFWWECHEVFEGFWRAAPKTVEGCFFQALIHVAAANLKIDMNSPASADRLSLAALERFHMLPQKYMGIDIGCFARDVRAYVIGSRNRPALIRLLTAADTPA